MEKNDLPESWIITSLERCVKILDGKRIPINSTERTRRQGIVPYYGATGQVGLIDDYIFDEELVLLGEDGAPFFESFKDKAYLISGKSWVNNHAHVLKGISGLLLNKFLCYYLNQIDYHDYVNGTTRLKLNQSSMKTIPIILPPLNEQKRIVEKIEELLSFIDFSKNIIFTTKDRLNLFREALLLNAITGHLTTNWRKNNKIQIKNVLMSEIKSEQITYFTKLFENDSKNRRLPKYDDDFNSDNFPELQIPEQWKMLRLGEIILHLTDYHSNASYELLRDNVTLLNVPDYAYMIRATNFVKNNFSTEMKYISKKSYDFLFKSKLYGGEILIGKIGNAGSVYLMPVLKYPASLAMNLFAIRFPKQVNSKYVYYHLTSIFSRQNIGNHVKGVGNPTIDKKSIRSLWISFPPIEEQNIIAEKLEKILNIIQKNMENLDILLNQYESLRLSILKQAFEGKLVPQDPNDESVSELLKRIKLHN